MNASAPCLLLVEDDQDAAEALSRLLRVSGYPAPCHVREAAVALLEVERRKPDLIFLDLHLEKSHGLELLQIFQERVPDTPVLVITGQDDTPSAVACMRAGARDFLLKPLEPERLLASLRNALEMRQTLAENRLLREHLLTQTPRPAPAFSALLTTDPTMLRLLAYAEVVANSPRPILITGENGTGKELLARAVHDAGSRRRGAWVTVNVAGLDEQNFSDTLFGHKKGAFTGAAGAREGLVRKAEGGDLLLDEIGDLRPDSQVKLLRLLQENEFFPLGSDLPHRSDARILATTNRDLAQAVQAGNFRTDLFYRLCFHHLHLPPLRERPGDLRVLVPALSRRAAEELQRPPAQLSPADYERLSAHDFPGNVRELEGLLFDVTARFSGTSVPASYWEERLNPLLQPQFHPPIQPGLKTHSKPFPPASASPHISASRFSPPWSDWPQLPTLQEARAALIDAALQRTQGNRSAAARMLGITPQALHQHLLRKT